MSAPTAGARIRPADGGLAQEWTGTAWTAVCPTDNVAMTGRDDIGHLCCQVCGRRYVDLAGGAR